MWNLFQIYHFNINVCIHFSNYIKSEFLANYFYYIDNFSLLDLHMLFKYLEILSYQIYKFVQLRINYQFKIKSSLINTALKLKEK
jgi:hypothetical protein